MPGNRNPTPKQLANLKPVKKGEIRNPEGKQNVDLRRARQLTSKEVSEVATFILDNNLEGLKAVKVDPASSVLRVWIASVAIRAIERGDASSLSVILDRIVGRAKENIQLSVEKKEQDYSEVSTDQLKQIEHVLRSKKD